MPFTGKKEEEHERGVPRYFATIQTKDVSTFAPPPKRVGNIPGARPEDRNSGPSSPTPSTDAEPASTNARPAPPLPSRSSASIPSAASPPPKQRPAVPPKTVGAITKLTTAAKPTPQLPPRRESVTVSGPSQDSTATTAPSPPPQDSSYGQLRKAFGTAMDSNQVSDARNALRKSVSANPSATTSPSSKVTLQDARTASGLAQKYRSDPNSLTFADAKAGLNVANKILPPPTDKTPPNRQDAQTAANIGKKWSNDPKSLGMSDLKAGLSVANKFRPTPQPAQAIPGPIPSTSPPPETQGVSDLRSRFSNVGIKSPPATSPVSEKPPSPAVSPRKVPPPPRPKPHILNGTSHAMSATAAAPTPNINLTTKPPRASLATQSPSSWVPRDIPLNFEKKWYCSEPMQQIPYLAANSSSAVSSSSISASGSGYANHLTWIYNATFAIRWTSDLSRTFIRVTWSSDDPSNSVEGRQKHFPPPIPLSANELEKAADLYGSGVVRFCQAQLGRQVGNGECWTLAHDALESVQGSVQPKVMVSQGKIHGQCIYRQEGQSVRWGDLDSVRPGDIVQYLECKFERRENGRLVFSSSAGAPDHTSYKPRNFELTNRVVTGKRGGTIDILHQNVGGVRKVQKGDLIVNELVSGKLWIYRPVWETWAGSMEPKWDNSW